MIMKLKIMPDSILEPEKVFYNLLNDLLKCVEN